jgi:OOP family OmpA-OmpF porin
MSSLDAHVICLIQREITILARHSTDSKTGVVANLDKYNQLSGVSVTFGFDKYVLTADDKKQLDDLAANLPNARGYILEVTGGTDSVGDAVHNYQLSQRRRRGC